MEEFNEPIGQGQVEFSEHATGAAAKRVVPGHLSAGDHATEPRTIDPINGVVAGASASITLLRDKTYRVMASTACYFRLSVGASTALVGDIYLPANTEIRVRTEKYDTLSFIQFAAGGIIQAVELK